MKQFGSQLHKKAKSIRLSAAERRDLRDRLVSYMEYHPLPKTSSATRQPEETILSEAYTTVRMRSVGYVTGVLAMLVLIGVPVVAERAMPGDTLYPVKVQFNEELRSTLAFSPYAKVEWETERLERRLSEARLLADEGRLTNEIEAEVAQAVQTHSEAAKQEIAEIRETDSDEAAIAEITFASALEVQSEVLESRQAQANEAGRSVAVLAEAVETARRSVEAAQAAANPSYEKLLARLEMETTHAQELFASIEPEASGEEVADIERRFADIKRKIDESIALHQQTTATSSVATASTTASSTPASAKDLTGQAKTQLKTALTDTRKLISFMTDIDVRTSVSIDELVPVTLTEAELKTELTGRLAALRDDVDAVDRTEPDEDMAEKFVWGQTRLVEQLEKAQTAFTEGDYELAHTYLTEAESTATDLLTMGTITNSSTSVAAPDAPAETSTTTGMGPEVAEPRATGTATSTATTTEAGAE